MTAVVAWELPAWFTYDPLREVVALLAAVLVAGCAMCAVTSDDRFQAWRFVTVGIYGAVTAAASLRSLGAPYTWMTWLILLATLNALAVIVVRLTVEGRAPGHGQPDRPRLRNLRRRHRTDRDPGRPVRESQLTGRHQST